MAGLGRIAEFHHVSGTTVALLFKSARKTTAREKKSPRR
jgi:hypothetical protein